MRNGMYGWNPIGGQRQMVLKYAMSSAWIHTALWTGLATTFAAGVSFGGVFQNGSFESPGLAGAGAIFLACPGIVTGWVHNNNCSTVSELLTASGNFGLATLDGGQYISWGGNGNIGGTLQQTFDTIAGASYTAKHRAGTEHEGGSARRDHSPEFRGCKQLSVPHLNPWADAHVYGKFDVDNTALHRHDTPRKFASSELGFGHRDRTIQSDRCSGAGQRFPVGGRSGNPTPGSSLSQMSAQCSLASDTTENSSPSSLAARRRQGIPSR